MTPTRLGVAWTAAALLGIVVTAALTWSVSRLAEQRIGLSSAPPSAISGLAPVRPARRAPGAAPEPRPTAARPAPSRSNHTQPGARSATVAPTTSVPGAPTSTAAGPTHAAPPAAATGASPTPPLAAARSQSSGGEDRGDGRGASSGGGRDD